MPETYLTAKQLIDRWGGAITVKTLANWRSGSKRRGPEFQRFGSKIRYPLSAVEAYERAGRFRTTRDYVRSDEQDVEADVD